MRSLRSFLGDDEGARRRRSSCARSSRLRRTRIEYCSMLSGARGRNDQHRDPWLPLRVSRSSERFAFSADMSLADNVPVLIDKPAPESGGTRDGPAAAAKSPAYTKSARRDALCSDHRGASLLATLLGGSRRRIEIPPSARSRFSFSLSTVKLALLFVTEHHRRQVVRKGADADVVILHRLDVAVCAPNRDAVSRWPSSCDIRS